MLYGKLATIAAIGAAVVSGAPVTQDKLSYVEENGVNYTVFDHAATGAQMKFVKNSGICETTQGVNQYSGYLSVGSNMNMWFWFFEARSNPTTAPLATWFNGGPGCSSMIGLFQENGPCHFVNGASTPSINSYSWNNFANMLYVDQPIGVGFSYGTNDVTSTVTAAPEVWKLLQAFYAQFPQYENRDFGIFTESYGGHYGPEFAYYLEQQNAGIAKGTVTGEKINLVALGINNGWIDPLIQYKSYIDYAYNNSYNQIITSSKRTSYTNTYNRDCAPAVKQCPGTTGSDSACANAVSVCSREIENPIFSEKDYDVYDVRAPSNDPNPPNTYATYINSAAVKQKIGAQSSYVACSNSVGNKFYTTGDTGRSFTQTLGQVVQSGIQVVVWAGDADMICNYLGNFNVVNVLPWASSSQFASKALSSYTVAGKATGLFKTMGNLSWLQVFQAGHEVPFYQPAASLQVFQQTMLKKALFAT